MCQDCQPELQINQCLDGYNAFTITTANFTMPAEGAGVTINVSNLGQYTGKWASPGQIIFISSGLFINGYFAVVSSTSTSINIVNIEDTATQAYTQNAPPGSIFTAGSKVSPAGLQGPIGPQGPPGTNALGKILIDVDYNVYLNANNTFVLQKSIILDSDIFVSDKDTVELQLNVLNFNLAGNLRVVSLIKFEIEDGSNTVNLLPSNFAIDGGIVIPESTDNEKSTFFKLHISKNSSSTFNAMIELDSTDYTLAGDRIYGISSNSTPSSIKYKITNLGTIAFGSPLTLKIYTLSSGVDGVTIDWSKTIKQKLI